MMKLRKHLRDNNITFAEFGDRIGKTRFTVSRIVAGKVNVDRQTVQAILEATDGAITPNDLFDMPMTSDAPRALGAADSKP